MELAPSPTDGITRRSLYRQGLLITVLSLVLNLSGNGQVSLLDRDEPRYAGCTREMRQSGDWVHPTFNAEPRYHKPVLIYWLMLAGTYVGGDNPFGARLISSLAATATCLLVWAWGRRVFGPKTGLTAALVLATAPILVVEAKLCTTDATLMLLVTGCQFLLWELGRRSSWKLAAGFWALLGLGILTKAPAAPAMIVTMGVASWWWGGPTACWRRLRPLWGIPLCLAIALPWFVMIQLDSGGQYGEVGMGYHVLRRATKGIEGHAGFPGYYVAVSLAVFFPWSALVPAALVAAWRKRREDPAFGFLLGWVIGPLVFLELVRTKLIHYYLPAFPGAALLVGWALVAAIEAGAEARKCWPWRRLAFGTIGVVGSVLGVAFLAGAILAPGPMRGPCVAASLTLGAVTFLALRNLAIDRVDAAANGLFVGMALTLLIVGAWLMPAADPYRVSGIAGRRLAIWEAKEGAKPVLCTYQLPGVVYALGHPAPILRGKVEIRDFAKREGPLLTVLLPEELPILAKESSLTFEIRETIQGFNVEKARQDTLHVAIIRPVGTLASVRDGARR